jgi:tetratricopeptide (TPR) repeat protein
MTRTIFILAVLWATLVFLGGHPSVARYNEPAAAESTSEKVAGSKDSLLDIQVRLDRIQRLLDVASMAYQGCMNINLAIQEADSLLDSAPDLAQAYYLLGIGLHMRQRVCYKNSPANHADTPADAFSAAHQLHPTETTYQKAWAASDPESHDVNRLLDEMFQKNPKDAFAAFMIARRMDTPPDKAIELLSGVEGCVGGQGSLLGGLLEKRGELDKARDAYKMELYGRCEAIASVWLGSRLYLEGRVRFNLARVSLALGDLYESLRQLRLVDFLTFDSALNMVDSDERDAFADELFEKLDKRPLAKPDPGTTPKEAILALERAAIMNDIKEFRSLVSNNHPVQLYFVLKKKGQDYSCEDGSTVCLMRALGDLLPEAPTVTGCSDDKENRTRCSVVGRDGVDIQVVELVKMKGTWKVLESKKAAEEPH